jgi:hypothetical protein
VVYKNVIRPFLIKEQDKIDGALNNAANALKND